MMLLAGLRSKWVVFVFACVVFLVGTAPAQAAESVSPTIFHRLYEGLFGKQVALAIDIPECLIELKGGINEVEATLSEGIKDGKKWVILVTASGDKPSLIATKKYYEAVTLACNPPPKTLDSTETKPETQTPAGAFDDDTSDQTYVEDASDFDLSEWKFAYMSFVGEPDLIWRWWIWKVPSIVFVSAPTQDQVPFDMRFWKIAFSMPSPEGMLAAIGTGGWKNIDVWQSRLAPGGSLERIPDVLGKVAGVFYGILDPIPTWLLTILASVLGTSLISTMHGSGGTSFALPIPLEYRTALEDPYYFSHHQDLFDFDDQEPTVHALNDSHAGFTHPDQVLVTSTSDLPFHPHHSLSLHEGDLWLGEHRHLDHLAHHGYHHHHGGHYEHGKIHHLVPESHRAEVKGAVHDEHAKHDQEALEAQLLAEKKCPVETAHQQDDKTDAATREAPAGIPSAHHHHYSSHHPHSHSTHAGKNNNHTAHPHGNTDDVLQEMKDKAHQHLADMEHNDSHQDDHLEHDHEWHAGKYSDIVVDSLGGLHFGGHHLGGTDLKHRLSQGKHPEENMSEFHRNDSHHFEEHAVHKDHHDHHYDLYHHYDAIHDDRFYDDAHHFADEHHYDDHHYDDRHHYDDGDLLDDHYYDPYELSAAGLHRSNHHVDHRNLHLDEAHKQLIDHGDRHNLSHHGKPHLDDYPTDRYHAMHWDWDSHPM